MKVPPSSSVQSPEHQSPGPRMEVYVAFSSLKKETLVGFRLGRSYPCPGCLCCLLWVSGCGVQS